MCGGLRAMRTMRFSNSSMSLDSKVALSDLGCHPLSDGGALLICGVGAEPIFREVVHTM